MTKLHLGCGERRLPNYIHVDKRRDVDPEVVANVLVPMPMFEDDSADVIYASHMVEHIPRPDLNNVLLEWRRILKPGGTLRIAVPDFSALVYLYEHEDVHLRRILGMLYGRQDYPENIHYCVYDYETLAWELCMARYYDIRSWDPQIHPEDYDDYSLARLNRRWISLCVEATASDH